VSFLASLSCKFTSLTTAISDVLVSSLHVRYAFAPLCILFEKDPLPSEHFTENNLQSGVQNTALLIPCYKSAGLLPATLEAALRIFPPSHIFVLNNGNSDVPLDGTEDVCEQYRVNHLWCPIGSKIIA
jgi:hypothetical protein